MSFDTTPVPPFTSSDLTATYCAMTTYELLLIELVPLAERLSTRSAAVTTSPSPKSAHPASTVPTSTSNGIPAPNAYDFQEAVHHRLNLLGYRVGLGLAERFSRDRPRFLDTLEVIKFLCKELWMVLWKKQVDNLKTNHRGVYVLTDNTFRPMSRMSLEVGKAGMDVSGGGATPFLYFPCGIIRGVLAGLGVDATVLAETGTGGGVPGGGAVFQVKVTGEKSL